MSEGWLADVPAVTDVRAICRVAAAAVRLVIDPGINKMSGGVSKGREMVGVKGQGEWDRQVFGRSIENLKEKGRAEK